VLLPKRSTVDAIESIRVDTYRSYPSKDMPGGILLKENMLSV
jgi:hypothetical protein